MKYLQRCIIIIASFFIAAAATAQVKVYSAGNAHSHNDYENAVPFSLAFASGFGSIEADIYAVKGVLYVAHNSSGIKPERTLKALYLDPLLKDFSTVKNRKLNLLVDVKDDYTITLPLLVQELAPLKKFLSIPGKPDALTIVISGNRPAPAAYKDYPGFIFFDDDLKLPHTATEWKRVALVSLPFTKISRWKGEGPIDAADATALQHVIDSVHTAGKPIRFWAAPDTKDSWKTQEQLKVDLIGTDKIKELTDFLHKEKI